MLFLFFKRVAYSATIMPILFLCNIVIVIYFIIICHVGFLSLFVEKLTTNISSSLEIFIQVFLASDISR